MKKSAEIVQDDKHAPGAMKKAVWALSSWIFIVGLVSMAVPAVAGAYEINTGFSDACHESMSGEGAARTVIGSEDGLVLDDKVPLPRSETWDKISELLLTDVDVTYENDRQKFALVSLVLGSRYPDSGGEAVVNLSSSREMHVYSASQEQHCLRAESDDGPDGNRRALHRARNHIREEVERAASYGKLPPEQQVITRETFVEFYGEVEIEVWAPAFYAGFALHAFQDCFSHTIRTDDLYQVLHVLNYTEAITEDHQPARDGLAHSRAMDRCNEDAAEIAAKARLASEEFLLAFSHAYRGQGFEVVDKVLADWTTYSPGCTVENNICDSKWLTIAEQGKAGPLVNTPSCSTAGGTVAGGLPAGGQTPVDAGWLALVLLVGTRLACGAYSSTSRTNSRNK